jgi:hypothetical protein
MRKKKLDWAVVTPSSILLRGTKEYNFLENTTKRIEGAKRGTKEKLLIGNWECTPPPVRRTFLGW